MGGTDKKGEAVDLGTVTLLGAQMQGQGAAQRRELSRRKDDRVP